MARIEGVRTMIQGNTINTMIKIVPMRVVTSAEKWHELTKSVELEITGFAKLFLEDEKKGRTKGKKRRVGKRMGETMERGRKPFSKALREGQVDFIDPEDVAS